MAESLIEIKRKISSTKKTSQITSAMQMVSGAKLNKSEAASRNFQKYSRKVRATVTHLALTQLELLDGERESDLFSDTNSDDYHNMLVSREIKRTGYIVITADKGLAGGYNSSVIKQTYSMIKEDHDDDSQCVIIAIGRAGADFFKSRGLNIAYEFGGLSDHPVFDEVRTIVKATVKMYENEVFDELYVCYNHHINSLASEFRAEKMLPISDLDPGEVKTYELDYILEPSQEAILDKLLPQYAESLIYGAILDAKTAEHAARMAAMKSATDNATNIIEDLTISYNRARQAMITQEITEIVGGAAALE